MNTAQNAPGGGLTKPILSFNLKACTIYQINLGGERINKSGIRELSREEAMKTDFHFRKPNKDDGTAVWELIKDTGVLDLNSSYSYLMWCEIFSGTSIVTEREGQAVGFISGFIRPDKPDTLFIWQVAVNESERGNGLGTRMLFQLLNREQCEAIEYVEATVSPSNKPSQNLFQGLAQKLDTNCDVGEYFSSDDFPGDVHEDELLFKIGPIQD